MAAVEDAMLQPVSRCMTDALISVPQATSLRDAAVALRHHHVGLLLVTDGPEVVGVIGERDIVTAVADGDDLTTITTADRAKGAIVTIPADADVRAGLTAMMTAGTRHLLVVDVDGQPAGLLSARDLLTELSSA